MAQLKKAYIITCPHCGCILIMPEATKDVAVQIAQNSGWWHYQQAREWVHEACSFVANVRIGDVETQDAS